MPWAAAEQPAGACPAGETPHPVIVPRSAMTVESRAVVFHAAGPSRSEFHGGTGDIQENRSDPNGMSRMELRGPAEHGPMKDAGYMPANQLLYRLTPIASAEPSIYAPWPARTYSPEYWANTSAPVRFLVFSANE